MDQMLTDAQWARLAPLLPGRPGTSGGRGRDNRQFVEAVLWLARNGARWRALPNERGNWHTTYTRFQRWTASGVWARVLAACSRTMPCTRCCSTRPRCGPTSTRAGHAKKRAASPRA